MKRQTGISKIIIFVWVAFLSASLGIAGCSTEPGESQVIATATIRPQIPPTDSPKPLPSVAITEETNETVVPEGPTAVATTDQLSEPSGFCSQIPRPAVLLMEQGQYVLSNVFSGDSCQITFPGEEPGFIQPAGNALYYRGLDNQTQQALVKRLTSDGTETALPFTEVEAPAQLMGFAVSADGQQVAWSAVRPGDDGMPVSDMWLAGIEGQDIRQLVSDWPAEGNRLAMPIRFSEDGERLFFSFQPTGVGGSWIAFNGRYDTLYVIPVAGGEPVSLFECDPDRLLCLGDYFEDSSGLYVAYTDPETKTIIVQTSTGEMVNQFSLAEASYLGYPTFSPAGELAFYGAVIGEHANGYPIPQPGTIYRVQPPYSAERQVVKSDDSVALVIDWLDSDHIIYNNLDPGGNWSVAITDLAGQATVWGAGPSQFIAILR